MLRFILFFLIVNSASFAQTKCNISTVRSPDKTIFQTPVGNSFVFIKVIKSGRELYYATATAYEKIAVKGKGVEIRLDNGLVIEKPDAIIESKSVDSEYQVNSIFQLTDNDLKLFLKNHISGFTLYTVSQSVGDSESLINNLRCLIDTTIK